MEYLSGIVRKPNSSFGGLSVETPGGSTVTKLHWTGLSNTSGLLLQIVFNDRPVTSLDDVLVDIVERHIRLGSDPRGLGTELINLEKWLCWIITEKGSIRMINLTLETIDDLPDASFKHVGLDKHTEGLGFMQVISNVVHRVRQSMVVTFAKKAGALTWHLALFGEFDQQTPYLAVLMSFCASGSFSMRLAGAMSGFRSFGSVIRSRIGRRGPGAYVINISVNNKKKRCL